MRQHLTAAAPAITSVAPSVPPRLAAAVERCLHKEPIRRYRNAESFAEAIDLAFEHAKEIPAPLRVWLSQGQKELPARLAFVGIGAMTGIIARLLDHERRPRRRCSSRAGSSCRSCRSSP